jgi:ubiquinone/menaquinone biosynthesis C-methylase UbiE
LQRAYRQWINGDARTLPSRAPLASTSGPVAPGGAALALDDACYERLYETHARAISDDSAVGAGDFELIGRLELGLLLKEGLRPTDTLLDFGCGTARLGVHVVPRLSRGAYIGTDVSDSMLAGAKRRLEHACPGAPCTVALAKQPSGRFALDSDSVDMMCAFSVFTHMEHEDSFRYLKDARRVVRPQGKFVFSCLTMSVPYARDIFLASADLAFAERWRRIRNVTTTTGMMDWLSHLAGWTVVRWYPGDEPCVPLADSDEKLCFVQSVCVLQRDS